ncbi:two-component system OmpR family sensor kinase [Variovorax paradoxus]|jgi:two-component system OmpR family sensor kinase|uniref:ATP-binding protein n=1 Tax=Variovorax paradoxus TaxID=34073 RepID=UPI0027887907|nr:ATP-binding protein [Variovorax paradoxus]MDP9928769.1 two-component system OmpR family sensor kinase [Variovorax paradoxus]MDQ0024829.1 two-component system OmpR family sensor kinase [Variovorax paradoxus]
MMRALTGSLRARLLWFLLAAIVLAAGAQALVAYRTVLKEADDIFDYHMQQMALSLRAGLPPSAAVGGIGSGEQNFDFVVQVWTADGVRIFESAEQAALPQLAVLGFADVRARGTTYRVFSMQTSGLVIQVAQDMAARRNMAGSLALRTIAPVALMAPLLMLVVWWVVSRSLAPVARVRKQVASRQADDLSAVSEEDLPDEVRPLVQELNLLFDRVRHAFDAQKHFVADAAHELRSPLAALKLQVQGLQRAPDAAARDLAVSRLVAGIDRATRLVEQMLALARHEASMAAGAKPQPVDLAEVARLAISDAVAAAQARRIDIGVSHADPDAVVSGQPEALRMLLRNLIDNAVKYTPEEGRVDVGIATLDSGVELSVDDSGPGLPEEERERVLDRFYRSGEPQAPGSGLGLAIVKSIADLHGATVTLAASPSLGGLRVLVRFPSKA